MWLGYRGFDRGQGEDKGAEGDGERWLTCCYVEARLGKGGGEVEKCERAWRTGFEGPGLHSGKLESRVGRKGARRGVFTGGADGQPGDDEASCEGCPPGPGLCLRWGGASEPVAEIWNVLRITGRSGREGQEERQRVVEPDSRRVKREEQK